MTLDQLRDEYLRDTIGPLIYGELVTIAGQVVRRYNPRVYAASPTWSSALEDLVQEVVMDRLIRERQLAYAMTVAADMQHWHRLMERQVRRTLAHRRERTVVDNLLDRADAILDRAPFSAVRSGGVVEYQIAGSGVASRRPTDEELQVAIREAASVPITVGRGDERAPMVYSTPALEALLVRVAESLPTTFAKNDLDRILRDLLTQWRASDLVDIEGALQLRSESLTPEEHAEVNDIANRILAATDAVGRHILKAKLNGVSDQEVASQLGLSRPTVAHRKSNLFERVRTELDGIPQALADVVVVRLDVLLDEPRWNES